jgi:uncharacterized protein YbjT (DUF2867 family)
VVRSSLSLSDVGADPAKWSVSENAGQKSCRGEQLSSWWCSWASWLPTFTGNSVGFMLEQMGIQPDFASAVGAHCLPSTGSVSVSGLKVGAIIVASERRWVMSQKLAVVVTGGTGRQGGAVVKSLLERGHEVRAVTRSTDSAKARELANAGVTLVRASLEDTAALTKALEGATSLFAMTTPFEGGTQAETRQGISAADAAKAAGVHLVFTSAGSANRQTGIPHFDSKYEVEEHIANIGVRATVLAPVYFMENLHFGKEQLAKGIYATPLPPTRQLAQVAVADIGAVAVRLLEDPGRFAGKRFDLGSDDLTGNDVLAILSRVTGRPFIYFQVPLDVIRQRMGEDGAKMYEWFDRVGFTVDRAALRREFPDVAFHDFESWAKAQDWNTLLQGA